MGWLDWFGGAGAPAARLEADGPGFAPAPPAPRREDAVSNALTGLGASLDKGSAARPDVLRAPLTEREAIALVRFAGIAQRIVSLLPRDGTRKGWSVARADGAPVEDPPDVDVRGAFAAAAVAARRDGGAHVWIVTDTLDRASPMRPGERVRALHVIERSEANVRTWDGEPKSPGYRMPLAWDLSPHSPVGLAGVTVHASRLVYVDGVDVDRMTRINQGGYGDSALNAVWDAIRNYRSIGQAGAVIAQELNVNILKIGDLAGLSTSDQAAQVEARIRAVARSVGLLNMLVIGSDEEFASRSAQATGYGDLTDAAKDAIAADCGIPAPILFGTAPGGLNADGEAHRDTWARVVEAWQEDTLRRPLTTYYARVTGDPRVAVTFAPLEVPSRRSNAEIEEIEARADDIRIASGVLDPLHVARSRYGVGATGGIAPLEEGDLEAFEGEVDEEAPGDEEAASR